MSGFCLGFGYAALLGNGLSAPIDFLSLVATLEGTIEVTTSDGITTITLTVTAPAGYAGSYVLDPALLATGPVNLLVPKVSGTGSVGATLTAAPGLWAFDPDLGELGVFRSWQDAQGDIPGQTAASLVLGTGEAGETVTCTETAIQDETIRLAISNGIAVPAAPAGGTWSLTPGNAAVLVASMPSPLAAPAIGSAGNGSVTLL